MRRTICSSLPVLQNKQRTRLYSTKNSTVHFSCHQGIAPPSANQARHPVLPMTEIQHRYALHSNRCFLSSFTSHACPAGRYDLFPLNITLEYQSYNAFIGICRSAAHLNHLRNKYAKWMYGTFAKLQSLRQKIIQRLLMKPRFE